MMSRPVLAMYVIEVMNHVLLLHQIISRIRNRLTVTTLLQKDGTKRKKKGEKWHMILWNIFLSMCGH